MTTTTLVPGSITEVLEAHEFAPVCENQGGCDRPAEIAVYMTCGCICLLCMPCRDYSKRIVNNGQFAEGGECLICKYDFGPIVSWERVTIDEVPL